MASKISKTSSRSGIIQDPAAKPKLPAWNYRHDPEPYAYEKYNKTVGGIQAGARYVTDLNIPPNYPPG